MHAVLKELVQDIQFTGDLKHDIYQLLGTEHHDTAEHCMNVGHEARKLAVQFGADGDAAELAGWLHDISAIIPNHERIDVSRQLGIDVLPEEEVFPMIIHQKLSKVMAREIFNVHDLEVLDAISCHTTLRANSTLLDQVLFVADKIAWDGKGTPPYIDELNQGLQISIQHGAYAYINYLYERRDTLKVVHPWLLDAYHELKDQLEI